MLISFEKDMHFFETVIKYVGSSYDSSMKIYNVLGIILSTIVVHRAFYFVIGMFFTRRFKTAKKKHKYAICIAARNEEMVIGSCP